MKPIDYYEVLGVSPNSEEVVIRAAYKAMMLKHHPDTSRSPDAEARSKAINEAFAVLSNAEKRQAYDAARTSANAANSSPPPPPPPHPPPPPPPPPPKSPAPPPPSSEGSEGVGTSISNGHSGAWLAAAIVVAFIGLVGFVTNRGSENTTEQLAGDDPRVTLQPAATNLPVAESQETSLTGGQVMHELDFSDGVKSQSVVAQGVRVRIDLQDIGDWTVKGLASIELAGLPIKLLDLGETNVPSYQVGIGKLASNDAGPSVIIKTVTGGAHCCVATTILQARGERLVEIDFGTNDPAADFDEFPSDVDGDGIMDFVMADGAFLSSFTNYAASWAPPKVTNVFKGSVVDVSDQPGFRSYFEEFSKKSGAACADQSDVYRNGACAAFVASEARLGRAPSALAFAEQHAYAGSDAWYPQRCNVEPINNICPPNQLISFSSFGPAIRWFLYNQGYM